MVHVDVFMHDNRVRSDIDNSEIRDWDVMLPRILVIHGTAVL